MATKLMVILEDTRKVKTAVTPAQLKTDWVGITEATSLLHFKHAQYTRRLILEDKLEAVKVQMEHYTKWFASRAGITKYLAGTRRVTEHRRYILRMDLESEAKVRQLLKDNGIAFDLELNYSKAPQAVSDPSAALVAAVEAREAAETKTE